MYKIGDRLKEYRICKELSRIEVAEILHITPDYLARIETGTQPVTYRMIERMEKYTDWNSDYILHEYEMITRLCRCIRNALNSGKKFL